MHMLPYTVQLLNKEELETIKKNTEMQTGLSVKRGSGHMSGGRATARELRSVKSDNAPFSVIIVIAHQNK